MSAVSTIHRTRGKNAMAAIQVSVQAPAADHRLTRRLAAPPAFPLAVLFLVRLYSGDNVVPSH